MQVIGITGGVGAGKSAILEYLEQNYRVKNLIADKIAKRLMEPGSECYRKLLKFLPVEVYNDDETINRGALSAAIFSSDELRVRVNEVMHPAVKEYIIGQIAEQERMGILDYVIVEAAPLLHFFFPGFNQQFVVNLQNQPGTKPLFIQRFIDPYHCNLDNIRRGSLDRRIHSHPLPKRTLHKIPR